jgi:hypothetical protein
MGFGMSDLKLPLPPYLMKRRGSRLVDRSRVCVHDDDESRAGCEVCLGTGVRPRDGLSEDAIRAMGLTPLPPDHPANFVESYIPGKDGP